MNREGGYIAGGHWATCDICGLSYRNYEMKKNSDGLVVCPYDYEDPHPQEGVRMTAEKTRAKYKVRPPTANKYNEINSTETSVASVPDGTFDNSL